MPNSTACSAVVMLIRCVSLLLLLLLPLLLLLCRLSLSAWLCQPVLPPTSAQWQCTAAHPLAPRRPWLQGARYNK
jgi:hypothetical protein